jgi:hypothetical protein
MVICTSIIRHHCMYLIFSVGYFHVFHCTDDMKRSPMDGGKNSAEASPLLPSITGTYVPQVLIACC